MVEISAADWHRMIPTSLIRASDFRALREIGQQTGSLLVDRSIALDRREFAAQAAGENRNAGARGLHDVGVLLPTVGGRTAQHRRLRRDAVVSASGILAEIDLDAADFGRIPA